MEVLSGIRFTILIRWPDLLYFSIVSIRFDPLMTHSDDALPFLWYYSISYGTLFYWWFVWALTTVHRVCRYRYHSTILSISMIRILFYWWEVPYIQIYYLFSTLLSMTIPYTPFHYWLYWYSDTVFETWRVILLLFVTLLLFHYNIVILPTIIDDCSMILLLPDDVLLCFGYLFLLHSMTIPLKRRPSSHTTYHSYFYGVFSWYTFR